MTKAIEHTPQEGMSLSDNWADVEEAIDWFASMVYAKFKQVDHKGHWRYVDVSYLTDRLDREMEELIESISIGNQDEIIGECIDVANCALMIADWVRKREVAGGD